MQLNVDGRTAIVYAAAAGHTRVVEILLEAGAKEQISEAANEASNNNHNEIAALLRAAMDMTEAQ
jgi:ankyrin repeat protein